MVKQNINVLIDACIEQMRADRYDETCIEVHRRRWQKGIVSYLNAQGTSEYTEQAGLDFLSRILPGLAPSTQRGHQRGINLLTEFMHTGVVRRRIVTLVEHPLPGELGTIVLKYLEDLKAQRRADQTISNHRRLLSYFLEGLRGREYLSWQTSRSQQSLSLLTTPIPARENTSTPSASSADS